MPTREEITGFLIRFKTIAQNNFYFVHRQKNLNDLSRLGIKISQAKSIIMGLTIKDYCSGPEKDEGRSVGNVWIFGVTFDNEDIYIKISDNFNHNVAKCISFHKAEYKLNFPFS